MTFAKNPRFYNLGNLPMSSVQYDIGRFMRSLICLINPRNLIKLTLHSRIQSIQIQSIRIFMDYKFIVD
jgi:hypothetical protein